MSDIVDLRRPFQWGWRRSKYESGRGGDPRPVDELEAIRHALSIDEVDAAIMDPMFWNYIVMLEYLYGTLQSLMTFAESCPLPRCASNLAAWIRASEVASCELSALCLGQVPFSRSRDAFACDW